MLELAAPAGEKEDMLGATERSIVKFADWIVVSATGPILLVCTNDVMVVWRTCSVASVFGWWLRCVV